MEKTFLKPPTRDEASSAALVKQRTWLRDWLWISLMWLVKLGIDGIFWKNQEAEYSFDNVDYLDHAKQYFYARDAASFYGIFLSSFGHLRSPFQSWLIFVGKRAFHHASYEAIAYAIQAACLLFLTVAALQISKRITELWNGEWTFPCTLAMCAAVIFDPLSIGISRGTVVELMLTASIVGIVWVCSEISRNGTANQVCALNLLVAVGDLAKFSFPTYVVLPLSGILIYGTLRRKYSAIFFSLLFQSLVQVGFCYNIVNFNAMLANGRAVMQSFQLHHPSIFREVTVNGFGVPFLCFVLFLGAVAVKKNFENRRAEWEWRPVRWAQSLLPLRPQSVTFEKIVLFLAAANLFLMLIAHLRATVQNTRYFFPFVISGIFTGLAFFAVMDLRRRTKITAAGAFATANIAVCALFSIPTAATSCSHPVLATVFNMDCERAFPVDGTLFAPRTANYHVFDIVRLLSGRIVPGSKVLIVNPNEYFNAQNFYYHLRDTAAIIGFYFNVAEVGPVDPENPDAWREAKAVIVKDFTDYKYGVFVEDSPPPGYFAPGKIAELNAHIISKLAQVHALEIYRNKNSDGTVSVYLIDKE